MSKILTFGTVTDFNGAGYTLHDSDGSQQVVLSTPMPADSFGMMSSRVWRREHWSIPEQVYDSGTWAYDSGWGDSATLEHTNYFWVRRLGEQLSGSESFDSYNFTDSHSVMIQVCRLDDASIETGISNMWKPVSMNVFMFQKDPSDDDADVDSNLRSKFLSWANSSDSDGVASDDEDEAITSVATAFGSGAFTGPALRDAIDSAISAGLWNDSFIDGTLNKLGGAFDTLRNVNLLANIRGLGGFTLDSYRFDEYVFDHFKDSSLWRSKYGPDSYDSLGETDITFYLRLEDSTFDPTDIETY